MSNLTVDETFAAVSVTMDFGVDGIGRATGVSSSQEGFGSATVTYDVGDDSFNIDVGQGGVDFDETFVPADINAAGSDATFTLYERANGEQVLIFLNALDPILNLNYVTFGNWIDVSGANNDLATGFAVFGICTDVGDVPNAGTATYNGETAGTMVNGAGTIFTVSGFAALTANFATGSVDGDFTMMGALNVLTNTVTPWRDFTTTGTITGNTFSGAAASKDGVLSGTHSGGFFGPAAGGSPEEIGGVWRLIGGGEEAVGGFVGQQ